MSEFYLKLNTLVSVMSFFETCVSEENISRNSTKISTFQLKSYVTHQVRSSRKGEELYIFFHESLCYKVGQYLSINSETI